MYSNNKKKLFLFNSASGVVQLILTTILVFVSIPVFFNNLGEVLYGVFAAVSVIGNLSVFANISLDTALIKYISEQGKTKESDHDILVTFSLLFLILIPLTLLVFIFKNFILLTLLKVPSEFLASSSILLNYLLLSNFLLILGKTFTAILNAKHKIYLNNLYLFIYSVLYWGGIILVILRGYGLEQIGLAILVAAIVWFVMSSYSALKSWGRFDLNNFLGNFERVAKKQISYSYKVYIGGLLAFLYEPLTKILISNLFGVSYVGIYEVMLKVKGNILSVFSKLMEPLQPIIAHEQNLDRLKSQIKNSCVLLFYIIVPPIVILLLCTDSIISLWIDGENDYLIAISTKIITSLSLTLVTTVTPIYLFLRLKNHPGKEIYIQSANVVVNALVILLTYRKLGYYSVILAYVLSLIVPYSLCIFYQKKYLNFYPFSSIKKFTIYGLYFIGLYLVTGLFTLIIALNNWINIIFVSVICCSTGIVLLYFASKADKDAIQAFLNFKKTK